MRRFIALAFFLAAFPAWALVSIVNDAPQHGGASFSTFDPATDLQSATLSNGNLTATAGTCAGGTGGCAARSTTSHGGTDKVRFQFVIGTSGVNTDGIGVQSSSFNPATANNTMGKDSVFGQPGSTGWYESSTAFESQAVGLGFAGGTCFRVAGNIMDVAIDFGSSLIWGDCWNGSAWQGWNNAAGNPDAGTGGYTFNTSSGPYFIGVGMTTTGQSYTINVGATSLQSNVNVTAFSVWH